MMLHTSPVSEALLVEDEEFVRVALAQTLALGGFNVIAVDSAEQALDRLKPDFAGLVITDVRLGAMSGLGLLAKLQALDAELPVIVMTGHGHIAMAVEAMRNGAYDFLEKPFPADRLLAAATRAQDKRRLVLENRSLKAAWAQQASLPPLLGQSAPIERLRQLIASLGPANVDILVNGQTGTGKEVVARHLHAASGRTGEFVALNCGALPEAIFESEIFGYEPGAFTSAQKRRIGKLEFANGGTLFLDEIESLPLTLQVKLLRVLQERKLERLGSNASIALDCRVIAASKVDLLELSAKGLFRDDLFYRIAGVSLDLPALAQRRDDIPLLLSYFMQMATLRFQRPFTPLTPAQLTEIQWRHWRGNVRELRSFADRLVLGVADLQPADTLNATPQGQSLPQQLDTFECQLIKDALAKSESVSTAAEYLGIPKKTLYDKLKKYQISL